MSDWSNRFCIAPGNDPPQRLILFNPPAKSTMISDRYRLDSGPVMEYSATDWFFFIQAKIIPSTAP